MAAVKKRISFDNRVRISKNYKLIKDNLDPNCILDHMIERQLISLDDALEIRAEKTRRRMVDALVEMLLLVGDRYNVFHDILRECGYGYMADILEGTDLQSTSNSVVEHDESLEKSDNTVLTSNRTDNTLYQNTSRTQVHEIVSDGVGSSTNKNDSPSYESDDNYLDVIHSEHMEPRWSENPEKNRIGLSTNDKQGCMAGDQPFTYDGQNVKNLPDEVTYVNDDIGTNRNSLTKHKGNSSKITKETNIPSVLALQNDGPDFQIDSNHYESVVKPCSPDHFYQCIKPDLPTTQPVYYNIDATSTSPVYERYSDDETNPHKEKQLQFATGSEENACSSIPVPKDDATGEHSSDGESYYDVANTNSVKQTCPVEPQSIKPTTKTTEMSVPPPTANILLKEPVMSGKRRNASHSNEEIDVPYQRELAHFPGRDENMNDREAQQEKRTLTMKVLRKSKELISYKSNTNMTMSYFNILAADKNDLLHIRCYQKYKFTMVREGLTYKFTNLLKKGDACWAVRSSTIAYAAPTEVAMFLLHQLVLPEEEPPTGMKRSLTDALESPQKSSVVGRIVQVSPIAYRSDGTLPVKSLCIKDNTRTAKVVLFADNASASYVQNSVIEINGLYKKTFQNKQQLTSTAATTCQLLPDDTLPDVRIEESDNAICQDDPDFINVETTDKKMQSLVLDTILEAVAYDACTNLTCRKKKMLDGKCTICQQQNSACTFRVKVSVVLENAETRIFTLFEKDAVTLFGQVDLTSMQEEDIISQMVLKLPVQFKGCVANNAIHDISK